MIATEAFTAEEFTGLYGKSPTWLIDKFNKLDAALVIAEISLASDDYQVVLDTYHQIRSKFVRSETDMANFRASFYGKDTKYPKIQALFFRYRQLRQKIWRKSAKGQKKHREYQRKYMALKRAGYRPWNASKDTGIKPDVVTLHIMGADVEIKAVRR